MQTVGVGVRTHSSASRPMLFVFLLSEGQLETKPSLNIRKIPKAKPCLPVQLELHPGRLLLEDLFAGERVALAKPMEDSLREHPASENAQETQSKEKQRNSRLGPWISLSHSKPAKAFERHVPARSPQTLACPDLPKSAKVEQGRSALLTFWSRDQVWEWDWLWNCLLRRAADVACVRGRSSCSASSLLIQHRFAGTTSENPCPESNDPVTPNVPLGD